MHFVKSVSCLSDYKLHLTFEDGTACTVDLEPHLDGKIFEPLKDPDYFKTVGLNEELETIVWDNGADFSPDFLYELGQEATGRISVG